MVEPTPSPYLKRFIAAFRGNVLFKGLKGGVQKARTCLAAVQRPTFCRFGYAETVSLHTSEKFVFGATLALYELRYPRDWFARAMIVRKANTGYFDWHIK